MAARDGVRVVITVETVAEVQAVSRQTVSVEHFPPDDEWPFGTVQMSYKRHGWGDLQFISFPADKAAAVAQAILDVLP